MDAVLQLYHFLKKEKKKERFDIILEPLQAITQLALLSFCQKGSKLSIANNLLVIQQPGWGQGIWRSYNHDGKEDLFFLFNAIVRFNHFYAFLQQEPDDYCDLFDLLILLSKRGIDKLLQTYANVDQPALLHTLHLYRNLLDKPALFQEPESASANASKGTSTGTSTGTGASKIDNVFIGIRDLYVSHEYIILYQTLLLLEKNPDKGETYIQGLTIILSPVYEKIQKWIVGNIVY